MSELKSYKDSANLSGFIEGLLKASANRLVMISALNSRGALLRSAQVPVERFASRGFGWWSRGWVGQVLGIGWCVATVLAGFRKDVSPDSVGDDWERYKAGKIPTPGKQ